MKRENEEFLGYYEVQRRPFMWQAGDGAKNFSLGGGDAGYTIQFNRDFGKLLKLINTRTRTIILSQQRLSVPLFILRQRRRRRRTVANFRS